MDAASLLADLTGRGIRLIAEGAQLAAEPASLLTHADRAQIRSHKAELLRLLSAASGDCSKSEIRGRPTDPDSEIARIENQARSLGWHPAQLWCSHFWPHPRGLAAVLDPGDRLTAVQPESIEITKADGSVQSFRRHQS